MLNTVICLPLKTIIIAGVEKKVVLGGKLSFFQRVHGQDILLMTVVLLLPNHPVMNGWYIPWKHPVLFFSRVLPSILLSTPCSSSHTTWILISTFHSHSHSVCHSWMLTLVILLFKIFICCVCLSVLRYAFVFCSWIHKRRPSEWWSSSSKPNSGTSRKCKESLPWWSTESTIQEHKWLSVEKRTDDWHPCPESLNLELVLKYISRRKGLERLRRVALRLTF